MWKRFLSLSRLQQIAAAVCIVHLFLAAALSIHHLATRRLRPAKPIAVRTHRIPAAAAQAPMAMKKEPLRPAPSAKPAAKPAVKADAPKKTPPAKPQPAKEKAAVKKTPLEKSLEKPKEEVSEPQEAWAGLAQNLKKMAEPAETTPSRTPLDLPPLLTQNPLKSSSKIENSDSFETDRAPSYEQFLIAYLQTILELPEYGEVRIEIEIDRFGNPIRCAVLESRSAKNGEYLKKRLPELSLPCFNDFGITDLTLTFNIVFRNVETH